MPYYRVHIKSSGKVHDKLENVSDRLNDLRPALNEIGDYVRRQFDIQFYSEGRLPGVSGWWHPLSDYTVRARGGYPAKILNDTGKLRDSYVNTKNRQNINTVFKYTARFGSSYRARNNSGKTVPIAKFHQEGTSKMPARPVNLQDRELSDTILDEIGQYLMDGLF